VARKCPKNPYSLFSHQSPDQKQLIHDFRLKISKRRVWKIKANLENSQEEVTAGDQGVTSGQKGPKKAKKGQKGLNGSICTIARVKKQRINGS
jgi:hypothetical protein